MWIVPELTVEEAKKLDRALDRIEAGISVYRTYGHPVKHHRKPWNMDGIIGIPFTPHPIYSHTPWFTNP